MRAIGIAIAWSITASAGCFYVEPINQRPSLDILQRSSDPVFRGTAITLDALASDPERHVVAFQWRVYACTDATSIEDCDLDPVSTGIEPSLTFHVPELRADPDGDGPQVARPVESLRVILEGRDDHGATARPDQVLTFPVLNRAPDLELELASVHGPVVTAPIEIEARYADGDDTAPRVTLEWTAFSPTQVPATLVDAPADPEGDSRFLRQRKGFTPQVTGNWQIVVVAIDPLGERTEKTLTVNVKDDGPPCLDAWEPVAIAQPAPVTEPTLFHVLKVRDDLDAFPRTSSAAFLGETEFTWSIKVGAGPRQVLANAANALAFDPQAYPPGTVVELRVEVFDRRQVPITCADGVQTCSVISQSSCIQRQTWHVEAR